MKKFYFSLIAALFLQISFAQNGELSGIVKESDNNEPLASASVRYEKKKGVVTDAVGKYVLSLPAGEYEIAFSSIGYKTQKQTVTIVAGAKQKLDITLKSDVFRLNEVVSVSQYKKNAAKETVSTSVIGKDQIKNTNSNDLGEAVNKTSGVLVQDGQISIRGGSSYAYGVGSRTAVLTDGNSLSSADLGQTQNTMVPLENVKQVEVIKGASSVIYGSSALNGVVNVITEWPTDSEPKTEVETNACVSDNPGDLRLKWWGEAPPFLGSVNVNHHRRIKDLQLVVGGNIYYNKSFLQKDDAWRLRAMFKTRYLDSKHPGLNYGVNGSVQLERVDQFFISRDLDDSAFIPAASSGSNYNKVTVDPHLSYSNEKGHNYKLNIRYMNIFRKGAGADIDAVSHFLEINNQYQYRFRKDLLIITAGVPFSFGKSQSNLYQRTGDHFNFNWAVYTQAEFNYKILSLQAGVRYEIAGLDTLIISSIPVFRAGMNIQASKSTNIRASWGQGYRIPSIAEKYIAQPFTTGVNIIPNDTLKNESGWSLEVGIQQGVQIKDWKLGVDFAFFWQEYKNFIEYQVKVWPNTYSNGNQIFPDSLEYNYPSTTFKGQILGPRAVNVDNARIAGYEIGLMSSGKIGPVGLNINAGYSYNFPTKKDTSTGSDHYSTAEFLRDLFKFNGKRVDAATAPRLLSYRIRHLVRADMEVKYWKLYLGATFYYASTPEVVPSFYRTVAFAIFKDQYAVDKYLASHGKGDFAMDLRAGIKPNDKFSFGFIVKNVTNNLYALRPGRPEPLRSYTFQFRYTF